MDKRNPHQLYEILQKSKRNNIYTNKGLHNGNQNLKCFSQTRPLSAQQPYQQKRGSPHIYLRSKQKDEKSPKPIKIGIFKTSSDQNMNLYFNREKHEQKAKYSQKSKQNEYVSSKKNIYLSKNINTNYGRGVFKGNYQNLFMQYPYQSQGKSQEKEKKRDQYTKYKTNAPFRPSGKAIKTVEEQNVKHTYISQPYNPINEDYIFRAKSKSTKYLSRFQWKPTTQFIKNTEK